MDKVARYRQIIQQVLEQQARELSRGNQVKIIPVCDPQHDQYLLVSLGWSNNRREHAIVFHAQLHNGQVLIEDDRTEEGLSNELIAGGIQESDIQLSWLNAYRPQEELPLVA